MSFQIVQHRFSLRVMSDRFRRSFAVSWFKAGGWRRRHVRGLLWGQLSNSAWPTHTESQVEIIKLNYFSTDFFSGTTAEWRRGGRGPRRKGRESSGSRRTTSRSWRCCTEYDSKKLMDLLSWASAAVLWEGCEPWAVFSSSSRIRKWNKQRLELTGYFQHTWRLERGSFLNVLNSLE